MTNHTPHIIGLRTGGQSLLDFVAELEAAEDRKEAQRLARNARRREQRRQLVAAR